MHTCVVPRQRMKGVEGEEGEEGEEREEMKKRKRTLGLKRISDLVEVTIGPALRHEMNHGCAAHFLNPSTIYIEFQARFQQFWP